MAKITVPHVRILDSPTLLEDYSDTRSTIYNIDNIEIRKLYHLRTSLLRFWITPGLVLLDDFTIHNAQGKVADLAVKEKEKTKQSKRKFEIIGIHYFPKPLKTKYTMRSLAESDYIDLFSDSPRPERVQKILAYCNDDISRVWSLTYTNKDITFTRERDLKLPPAFATIGKDSIISISKQGLKVTTSNRSFVAVEEKVDEFFNLTNGNIGIIQDDTISFVDIESEKVNLFSSDLDTGDTPYYMITGKDESIWFIIDEEGGISVYKITPNNINLSPIADNAYGYNISIDIDLSTNVISAIGDKLILFDLENDDTYLYDLPEKQLGEKLLPLNLKQRPIRTPAGLLMYNSKQKKGILLNENGNIVNHYVIPKNVNQFTQVIVISDQEKEELEDIIKTNLSKYVVKQLANIVSRFVII